MQIPKPTDADRQRFQDLVPDAAGVEVKPMFGNVAAFVNGNMFMGLFGSDVGLKLPEDAAEELRGHAGAGPFGPAERPMGGYVSLPPVMADDPATAEPWVARSLEHVSQLPPKQKKKK